MTARDWYRPLPPPRSLTWSMRNNTNYMETGVLSALELTAAFPKTVLENFYKKSRNSVDAGSKDAPYGYIFPANQKDLTRVAFVVNILRTQGIEVGKASGEIKIGAATYPAGSLVVKRNQPYGRLAKILLEKQDYPDPALTTYDDTAWTMGLMSHAEVAEIADKAILTVPVTPVDVFDPAGAVKGDGPVTAILHNGSNNLVTLRYRLKDLKFEALDQPSKANGTDLPAGTFLVASSPRVKAEVEKLGLQAVALAAAPEGKKHAVDIPRVAMFSTWGSTQDVGWVRYAFDKFELNYDLIYKDRIREGNLRSSYDVIVIPSQGGRGGSRNLIFDIEPKAGKKYAYKKDAEFPTLGMYGESDDISGGMGLPGVAELDKFVNAGGTLDHPWSVQFPARRFRYHPHRAGRPHDRRLLRPRPHRGGRDHQSQSPDLLRLRAAGRPCTMGRRPLAHRPRRRAPPLCARAVPRSGQKRPQRTHARRR